MSATGSGAAPTPGSGDFPERYPLCPVRTISGDYVSFCYGEVTEEGICRDHQLLRAGRGVVPAWVREKITWNGLDMVMPT